MKPDIPGYYFIPFPLYSVQTEGIAGKNSEEMSAKIHLPRPKG
jgi:hypothetical protein